ncbi:MAG: peptidase M23 [Persephonella sp.]|nr:MAG: peptidase M23 [Persephonella sp.]
MKNKKDRYIKNIKGVLNSYSEIIFLEDYRVGLVLLILTFINPNLAIGGIISVISAYLFAKFLNLAEQFLSSGFYTYNSLLVGLSIGYLFKIDFLTSLFLVIAGIFTFIISFALYSIFSYYLKIPILSFPFVIVSSLVYLSVYNFSNLFVISLYPHNKIIDINLNLPNWIEGYLKSLGALFFLPEAFVGLIITVILFLSSRILFLLSVIGYYVGSLAVAVLSGSFNIEFSDTSHFNFILISMALGGIFLIPSIRSYMISIFAVLTSIIVLSATKTFWALYGIPAFTLPFNLITLLFVYILGIVSYPFIAKIIRKTPEETLDFYLTNINRFKGYDRAIHLPFSGEWTVWQGFNGRWTHKGAWKYAYDFVITDGEGKTYRNEGLYLEDYYAYRKPVLSPIRGRIVKVINDLPDNQIGEVDKENNWGNLVIIYDERGFYVEISHFAYKSIRVREGDWVEIGTFLGLCGNSGYSPQPHIHIQVQPYDYIGAYTIPFSFVNYLSEGIFYSNDLPKENQKVEPLFVDKSLDLKTSFALDNRFIYEVYEDNKKIDEFEIKVEMALDGTFYFNSGKGKLYFGKSNGTFYFYRLDGNDEYLKDFFLSLPKLPLAYRNGIKWVDYIPLKTVLNIFQKSLFLLIASFHHNFVKVEYKGRFIDEQTIEGNVFFKLLNIKKNFTVVLDERLGIREIKTEKRRYVLKKVFYTS